MNIPLSRSIRIVSFFCALLTMLAPWLQGQTGAKQSLPVIEGRVHDSRDRPIVGAVVYLESAAPGHTLASATYSQGRLRFEAVSVETYTVHTKLEVYLEEETGPFVLPERGEK